MVWLSGSLLVVFVATLLLLPGELGVMKSKPKFTRIFARVPAINQLAGARLFLFASRDVWFVVGLPVFMHEVLGWTATAIGAWMAVWIIGYGVVQAMSPLVLQPGAQSPPPGGHAARFWLLPLLLIPAGIATVLMLEVDPASAVVVGLLVFGLVFAINSALHSFLVLAYGADDGVSLNVGFYYTANAAGRLLGTVLSGVMYQQHGLAGCLLTASALLVTAVAFSIRLPEVHRPLRMQAGDGD